MKLKIYTFGSIKDKEIATLTSYYEKLVSKYIQLELVTLKDKPREKIELAQVEKYLEDAFSIILSEYGKEFTTIEFANWLGKIKADVQECSIFVGNAFGFEKEVYDKANVKLSLSQMTLPHDLVLVVLMEQLFRCYNLLSGGKYHK